MEGGRKKKEKRNHEGRVEVKEIKDRSGRYQEERERKEASSKIGTKILPEK